MRCDGVLDEKGVPDSTVQVDYNLWSGAGKKARFRKVTMTGKKPGDEGFGAHDVPREGGVEPRAVVADPDVKFPFSDEDMLSRKRTVEEVLKVYRAAYSPKKGSPAVDAGAPEDKADPAVTDHRFVLVIEQTDAAFDPAKVHDLLKRFNVERVEERVESGEEARP